MATLAGELLIKMGLDVAQLRRDVAESTALAKTQAKAWESAAGAMKAGLAGIAASFTLDAVIGSFNSAVSAMAAMDDAAEITGTSVERLSGLMGVAAEAGVGLNGLTDAMQKLTKATLGNEQESAKAAQAWKLLKIDPTQFSDPADLLQAVAEGFANFADGARKAELAQALLGKSGQQMLPLLKDLADGGSQQGKITSEMAAEAERLEKQWARLSYEGGVFRQTIYSKIIPGLADLVMQFNKARAAGLGFFEALNTIPGPGADKNFQIDTTLKQITELERRKKAIESGSGMQDFFKADRIAAANKEIGELNKKLGVLRDQKADIQKRDPALADVFGFGSRPGLQEAPSLGGGSSSKGGSNEAERIAKAQKEALISAQRKLVTMGEESALATTYFEMTSGKYAEFDRATKSQLVTLARQTDERKKFYDQEAKILALEYDMGKEMQKIADSEAAQRRADVDKVAAIVGQTATAQQAEKARLQSELDKRYFDSGAMTAKQYEEATAILQGLSTEAKKTKDIFDELGATFESAFEKAMDGGATFSEFMSGLGKDLGKIFAREFISGPLMSQFKDMMKQMKSEVSALSSSGPSSSGGGSLLSSLFSIGKAVPGGSSDPGGSFSEGNYIPKGVTNIINIDSRSDAAFVRENVMQGVDLAYAKVADAQMRNAAAFAK